MHSSMPKKSYSFPAQSLCSAMSLPDSARTLAKMFSEAMGNDGQCFRTLKGVTFSDMLERISPWGVRHQYVAEGGIARYQLADGSAIIETGGCWDIEHAEYRFWMASGDPGDDDVKRHAEVLERAGYCIEPAEIDQKFLRDLTRDEVLFCRIFDVAIAQEPSENSPASNIRNWLEGHAGVGGLAEAAERLVRKGPSYGGQCGTLGGFTVYDEKGDDTEWQVVWSLTDGLWTDLETMLLLSEKHLSIPDWFESEWVMIRNANNSWVERCSLKRS